MLSKTAGLKTTPVGARNPCPCSRVHEKEVVVADLNGDGVASVAEEIGAIAVTTNVANEDEVKNLVKVAEEQAGPIDLFCSNAGIAVHGDLENSNEEWQRVWDVNLMSHVFAYDHLHWLHDVSAFLRHCLPNVFITAITSGL